MGYNNILYNLIQHFQLEAFNTFFRQKNDHLTFPNTPIPTHPNEPFTNGTKIAEGQLPDGKLIICSFLVQKDLTERSGKKAQYELGKTILKHERADAGIFIFYDHKGNFRFSFIYANYLGIRRDWSSFKRYTYYVSKEQTNKTFLQQVGEGDFSTLQNIQQAFSVEPVTKQFYNEIQNWYFWAMDQVEFPDDVDKDKNTRNAKNLIRLITRMTFVWFMKTKQLIPDTIFDKTFVDNLLNYTDKTNSTYYKAILQNLFFATLNTKMKKDDPKSRIFIDEAKQRGFYNDGYLQQGFYRYKRFIKNTDLFLAQFKDIPFLNGGLFECLDKKVNNKEVRIDGFSDNPKNETRLKVPDELFFLEEKEIDIGKHFGNTSRKVKVRGLIPILKSYNFTIDENTPVDEEIALDPELLGKVFENLLASYNPETETTARKATGSYYTPRQIVEYMVNESLIAYLKTKLKNTSSDFEDQLRILLDYNIDINPFDASTSQQIIHAIETVKILDPACGSGAFPMGILHKLVLILHKLDPDNHYWKALQKQKALDETQKAFELGDKAEREERLKDINDAFDTSINEPDYSRKLFLIKNCIYGVDIQEIAVQISKLRFFISLIINQKPDDTKPNRGILPLPNLETKFVAANTLIALEKPQQLQLKDEELEHLENQLFQIREDIFYANSYEKKKKLQDKINQLSQQLNAKLKQWGYPTSVAQQITSWDPFDQNTPASWFDPEWMFGIKEGFDIVIGNPPYINVEKIDSKIKSNISKFRTAFKKYDLYVLFYEKGIDLLKPHGQLIYITSNKFLSQDYGFLLRREFLKYYINQIINFNYNIFEEATVRTCIFHLQKTNMSNNNIKIIDITTKEDAEKFKKLIYNYVDQNIFNKTEKNNFRINLTNQKIDLLNKITKNSIKLEDICSVNYGLRPIPKDESLSKDIFIKNTFQKGYKVYFEGKDMGYWLVKSFSYLDYKPKIMYNPMFPELFERPKLAGLCTLSEINKLRFVYDDTGAYTNHSVAILTLWHLLSDIQNQTIQRNISVDKIEKSKRFHYYFIQGILNSKLIKFYVNELFYDGTHFYPNHMKSLPIKDVSMDQQMPIIQLVEKIHNKLKDNIHANVSDLEDELNTLVYKLYDLTPEEIKIVEKK